MTSTPHEKVGAYSANQRTQENSRQTDARTLLSCASRLKSVLDAGGADRGAYTQAIRHNQRLWTLFQVALCDPDNALPRDLKITLLNLSRYVDRMSFRAIGEFAPQLLTSLIDINRMIATGLSVRQTTETPPPPVDIATSPAAVVMTTA
jgi:flagellar biosynthesis activator protein FlaF